MWIVADETGGIQNEYWLPAFLASERGACTHPGRSAKDMAAEESGGTAGGSVVWVTSGKQSTQSKVRSAYGLDG